VGLPRLILLSFSRGLAKFEVAPGGLKGGNVDAAVVAIAGAIFFVFWGFGVGAFGLGGRALGLFHVADGFGLLDGGGFGEGAGFKAGSENRNPLKWAALGGHEFVAKTHRRKRH
jgi:hypothetical protein